MNNKRCLAKAVASSPQTDITRKDFKILCWALPPMWQHIKFCVSRTTSWMQRRVWARCMWSIQAYRI